MNSWAYRLSIFVCLSMAMPAYAQRSNQEEPRAAEETNDSEPSTPSEPTSVDDGAPAETPPSSIPEASDPYTPEEDPDAGIQIRSQCAGRRISAIEVEGNRRVSDDDVMATIRLRPGQRCRDADVSRDARSLWELSFFDDIVVRSDEDADDPSRIVITFALRERPAIGRVSFEGNDNVDNSDLLEETEIEEGAVLSLSQVREDLTKIRDKYADEGYFLAHVDFRLREMDNNQVEVVYQVQEGEQVTVRRIRFVGNQHLSDSELRGIIQTHQTDFFSFISNNDRFDPEHFEQDRDRLQAYYYNKGYLAMRVGTPRIELTPDREFIDLTIPISEGPRFRIGRLRVQEVNADGERIDPLGGRRQLREMVNTDPGDWFNRTRIAESLQAITRHYRDEGYARVDVNPETDLDLDRRIVNVALSIERGPLVRIERITVRGNTKTRDSVIRRELQIVEGDLYNMTQLELSRARVQALGFFERVELSESEGSADDRMVVTIEVAERSTGTFQLGAGFSSLESFILTGQVQQQNLFGNGQSLSLQLQLSGIRQLVQVQFFEPYFVNTQWSFGFEIFKTVRQVSFFSRDSTGGSLTLGHPLGDNRLRFMTQYRADYVDIGASTGGLFGANGFGAAGLNIYTQAPFENLFRAGLTSSLRLTLFWDGRNNRLFPTDGFYASFSSEIADEVIGSSNTFIRNNLDVRGYYPIIEGVVLRARAVGGLITSRLPIGVPIYERFFLGGILSVRGFPLNRLGPRIGSPANVDPNGTIATGGIPVGGNLQMFYNLEIEFPIVTEVGIRGVVFTDGGNVWNLNQTLCNAASAVAGVSSNDPCTVNPLDIRTSVGFGIRWVSPLGPLRFEWGIPINRIERLGENEIDFQFTIGNFF